ILSGDLPGVCLVRSGETVAAAGAVEAHGGDGVQPHGERRGLCGQLADGADAGSERVAAGGTVGRDGVGVGPAVNLDGGYGEGTEVGRRPAERVTDVHAVGGGTRGQGRSQCDGRGAGGAGDDEHAILNLWRGTDGDLLRDGLAHVAVLVPGGQGDGVR